jgi:tripeptide aminopeptidase
MVNQERLVNRFLKYVQIDSETRNEKAFADMLVEEMEQMGLDIKRDNAGTPVGSNTDNIVATLKGNSEQAAIFFSAHMDTVTPGNGVKPIVENGIIKTDGTTVLGGDDKAGIAAIMEAFQMIIEEDMAHGDVEAIITIAEEGGLNGSKNLDYSLVKSKRGFVLDSGGKPGEIIIQGPAQDKIDVTIKGKPAHAGVAPQEGISAIMVASEAISAMNLLRIDEETTANIGVIEGGQVTNIVCPEVKIKAEARSLSNEKLDAQSAHMAKCFEEAAEKFGAQALVEIERAYSAFKVDASDEIVEMLRGAMAAIGAEVHLKASGGGSDTNIYNGNGIKAVNLGVGMQKVHTLEEFIEIEDLVKSAQMCVEIIKHA